MDHRAQEKKSASLVQDLADKLLDLDGMDPTAVHSGSINRVQGKGWNHQIDVSVDLPGLLFLYECKSRESKPVTLSDVLVLLGRITDIQATHPRVRVAGAMITNQPLTAPAKQLADAWDIEHHRVDSPQTWSVSLLGAHSVGVKDGAVFGG